MLLALRINVLSKGHSGITPQTLSQLVDALNANCISCVPVKGTVGASGDLAQLSHLALGLMGEGEMWDTSLNPHQPASAKKILKRYFYILIFFSNFFIFIFVFFVMCHYEQNICLCRVLLSKNLSLCLFVLCFVGVLFGCPLCVYVCMCVCVCVCVYVIFFLSFVTQCKNILFIKTDTI